MSTTNDTTTFTPSTPEEAEIITKLEAAYDEGKRNSALLAAALELNATEPIVRYMLRELFSGYGPERFAWMPMLTQRGYTTAQLRSLLHAKFTVGDPDQDEAAASKREFLAHPPAWEVFEDGEEFVALLTQLVRFNPNAILRFRREIARRIAAITPGNPHGVIQDSRAQAMHLCYLAVQKITHIDSPEEIESVLMLRPRDRSEVIRRVQNYSRGANWPRLGRMDLVLLTQLYIMGELHWEKQADIIAALKDAVTWRPEREVDSRGGYGNWAWQPGRRREPKPSPLEDTDPERQVRAYRWILDAATNAPLLELKADWPEDMPAKIKEMYVEDIDKKLREAMERVGWKFVQLEEIDVGGGTQLQATVATPSYTLVYVQTNHPMRDEVIKAGDTVIVSTTPPKGAPLFQRGNVRGYAVDFHPAAPPCNRMRQAINPISFRW